MGDDASNIMKIGPAGYNWNAKSWDENGHKNIVQIFVSHNKKGIESIQFQYAESRSLVLSKRHGTSTFSGDKFDVVKLNHPAEYITSVSGHTKSNVCSITFGTNLGEYGPFGGFTAEAGAFCFKLGPHHQFHGFHGTANADGVQSIGVYLNTDIPSNYSHLNTEGDHDHYLDDY